MRESLLRLVATCGRPPGRESPLLHALEDAPGETLARRTIEGPAMSSLPPAWGRTRSPHGQGPIDKVPGCPNAAEVRALVEEVLAGAGVLADIEELEGPYPSPSVLVHGIDVTGRSAGAQAPAGSTCQHENRS